MDMPGILSILSDEGFADTNLTTKVAFINDAYWDVCSREAWPFLEKSLTLTFDGISAQPTNWPADFGTALSVIDTSTGTRLYPMRLEALRSKYAMDLGKQDLPTFYYFIARQLFVYPIPASNTQTLLLAYTNWPPALTDTSVEASIILPPRFHMILVEGALYHLYEMEDDMEQSGRAQTCYENKIADMRNHMWLRQADRYDTIEITDTEDQWD